MTTAQQLIRRALRLINVPGQGRQLSSQQSADALDVLIEILQTEAVARAFQPGIRRHFFALTGGQHIYSYGPGGDLDTSDFDDPVPIAIEDAYLRQGASITDNDLVTNGDFSTTSDWALSGTGGSEFQIANGKLRHSSASPVAGTLSQAITLTPGVLYKIKFDFELASAAYPVYSAGALFSITDGASTTYLSETPISSGEVELDFTPTAASNTLQFDRNFTSSQPASSTVSWTVDNLTVIQSGLGKKSLSDGTDYSIRMVDQMAYNRLYTKGTNGRSYRMLFSRQYPLAEARFDSAPPAGEILVMDVRVDGNDQVTQLSDQILLHPQAERYLRYRLAMDLAPEYGKQLGPTQLITMREAYDQMAASNNRPNMLRTDQALIWERRFEINRGDY